MLCLSGFELYARWVPPFLHHPNTRFDQPGFISKYVRYWNFQNVVKASVLMSLLKRN